MYFQNGHQAFIATLTVPAAPRRFLPEISGNKKEAACFSHTTNKPPLCPSGSIYRAYNFFNRNCQRPFYFGAFSKWALGVQQILPQKKLVQKEQFRGQNFYRFSTANIPPKCPWIPLPAGSLRPNSGGKVVRIRPICWKSRLASVVSYLKFQGIKNPETVDAVGVQPTASIVF